MRKTYVPKFWDNEPPREGGVYYAAQRESQNAALLDKIAAAVSHDTETLPIRLHAHPSGYEDAMDNLLAFSTEARQGRQVKDTGVVEIFPISRMKKCFGWLKIDGKQLCSLPRRLGSAMVGLPNGFKCQVFPDRQYFAIVHEYIPEDENDRRQMQLVLDFLWCAGSDFDQLLRNENWKSGVPVSDFISPGGYGWHPTFARTDASRAFLPTPLPPPPARRPHREAAPAARYQSRRPLRTLIMGPRAQAGT
ncbi:hypothetical protein VTI74DRAFT_2135 [Chaetomium olivicolor]